MKHLMVGMASFILVAACGRQNTTTADELNETSQAVMGGHGLQGPLTDNPGEYFTVTAPGLGYSNTSFVSDAWLSSCDDVAVDTRPGPDTVMDLYWIGSSIGQYSCGFGRYTWVDRPKHLVTDVSDSTSCTVTLTEANLEQQPSKTGYVAGTATGTIEGQPFTISFRSYNDLKTGFCWH